MILDHFYKKIQKEDECQAERGFTIFYAFLVILAIIAIATPIANTVNRQVQIATVDKRSAEARYAGESGRDCALYHALDGAFETTGDKSLRCATSDTTFTFDDSGAEELFTAQVDFGSNGGCANIEVNTTQKRIYVWGHENCDNPLVERTWATRYASVGSGSGPGPGPGPGPDPTVCAINTSPVSVDTGESVDVNWITTNATTIEVTSDIGPDFGVVGPSGTLPATINAPTTFFVDASGPGGSCSASATALINAPAPPAPTCNAFSATPDPVQLGSDVALSWDTTDATSISIDQGVGTFTAPNAPDGNTTHQPSAEGQITYTMTASNSTDSCQMQAVVDVVDGLTSGLIAWWQMDEGSGTTVGDSSGAGHNATLSGAAWTTSSAVGSGALSFDGSNDQVRANTSLGHSGNFTVSMFVKSDSVGSEYTGIFSSVDTSASANNFQIDYGGSSSSGCNGEFRMYRVGSEPTLCLGSVQVGTWVHLAVTYDGTTIRAYRNGVLNDQVTDTMNGDFANALIGTNRAKSLFHDGTIDDVRVYDRALSGTEIDELYNLGSGGSTPDEGPTNGLAGWWKYDEGSGGTAFDSSGQGNNGSIIGPSWTTGSKVGPAALSFDGSNDYVSHGAALNQAEGTIAHWVYPDSGAGHDMIFVYESDGTTASTYNGRTGSPSGNSMVEIHTGTLSSTNKWEFIYQRGGCATGFPTDPCLALQGGTVQYNQWSHVAVTWDEDGMAYLYVNGVQVASANLSGTTWENVAGTVHKIGAPGDSGSRKADGKLDDVRIYDRALSSTEITALYDATN